MSWTALLKAVPVVFGRALVCGSAPAFAAPTGSADGCARVGVGVARGVGDPLGVPLAAGDACWVALTGAVVGFPPPPAAGWAPAAHPASAASSAQPATARPILVRRRCSRTSVSRLVTTEKGTRHERFQCGDTSSSRTGMSDGECRLEGWQEKGQSLAVVDR